MQRVSCANLWASYRCAAAAAAAALSALGWACFLAVCLRAELRPLHARYSYQAALAAAEARAEARCSEMEKRVAAAEEALLGERAARVDALAEASVAKEEQALVEMQVTDLQMRLQEREQVVCLCSWLDDSTTGEVWGRRGGMPRGGLIIAETWESSQHARHVLLPACLPSACLMQGVASADETVAAMRARLQEAECALQSIAMGPPGSSLAAAASPPPPPPPPPPTQRPRQPHTGAGEKAAADGFGSGRSDAGDERAPDVACPPTGSNGESASLSQMDVGEG
eukprot:COSAG01_NODE_3560_length_5928_cov_6.668209_7_plen_283_part_00